ncbi:50S ribosomal protein L15 [Rhodohalobacter barkolensis]|uniref:Large ribosomal subunit protein uL15 n=1 Tax=Rhodohalobacter barkolensis TaxID=2053187 RepID=A0A2N0VFH9_9BACT|nr:50S ribosomal protein L15 [Rhodohalobacter barkolensis]PKD42942.1 50S ribosomal protein L15 [Rhodohalobacter barkolensis]
MKLHNLKAPITNQQTRKRVGRGQGSGMGEQSGRGHNGQKSRSGSKVKAWFEGGQMPLQRRVPKFGFKNPFRTEYQALNVQKVADFIEAGRLTENVTINDLVGAGLVDDKERVKLLGTGEISQKVSIEVHACSNSAKEKVESAGGEVTIIS